MGRCVNGKPKTSNYKAQKFYLSKGSNCPEEWTTYEGFKTDMWESFLAHIEVHGSDTSLDRIDNSKWYSKENCRWVTDEYQRSHKESFGRTPTTEFGKAKKAGLFDGRSRMDLQMIYARMKRGIPLEEAMTAPKSDLFGRKSIFFFNGEPTTLRKICEKLGLKHRTVERRFYERKMYKNFKGIQWALFNVPGSEKVELRPS